MSFPMGGIISRIKNAMSNIQEAGDVQKPTAYAEPRPLQEGLARTVFPPTDEVPTSKRKSVFLAGSIDMGSAIDWQADLTNSLIDLPITIYNPRRPNWDPTWTQSIDFAPFREQVEWELKMLEEVDVIAMYLPETSKAPISLLELGLFAPSGRLIVACPKKFWRQGNVEIVCRRYDVKYVETIEELETEVRKRLEDPPPPPTTLPKGLGPKGIPPIQDCPPTDIS